MRRLSDLPEDEARAALRDCCGSTRWVERMLSQRPFKDRDEVFASAERIWNDLGRDDWLEAFGAHPRIGQEPSATAHGARAAELSRAEQARAAAAGDDARAALAEANAAYEARFGYLFIVCAAGRSAEDLLAACRARLAADPAAELRTAAAEQARITRLRLERLLEIGS